MDILDEWNSLLLSQLESSSGMNNACIIVVSMQILTALDILIKMINRTKSSRDSSEAGHADDLPCKAPCSVHEHLEGRKSHVHCSSLYLT